MLSFGFLASLCHPSSSHLAIDLDKNWPKQYWPPIASTTTNVTMLYALLFAISFAEAWLQDFESCEFAPQ